MIVYMNTTVVAQQSDVEEVVVKEATAPSTTNKRECHFVQFRLLRVREGSKYNGPMCHSGTSKKLGNKVNEVCRQFKYDLVVYSV